jgi:hypothetical protein
MARVRIRLLGSIACAAALALAAPARGADPTPWDQAKATELAQQLAANAGAAYDAVYRNLSLSQTAGSGQSTLYLRLKDRVRVVRAESRHLAKALADGQSREETIFSFQRLLTTVRDIRVVGNRMMLDKPTLDVFAAAHGTLRELGAYYDPDALEQGPPPLTEPKKPE